MGIPESVFDVLHEAVYEAMSVVQKYQVGKKKRTEKTQVKQYDSTLLTDADKESGEAALVTLNQLDPTLYDFNPEDSKGRTTPGARYVVLFDNIDGTRAFTNGLLTSTVILAVYDRKLKKVVFCMIGEPITELIYYAELAEPGQKQEPCKVIVDFEGKVDLPGVNSHPLDEQATVFLDLNKGFVRKDESGNVRQIMDSAQVKRLMCALTDLGVNILMPGSNGLHQVRVAAGSEKCVGGITTAMGGPWDAAGVMLVIAAGGYARAFKKQADGTYVEADPLDPLSYDVVIYGNRKLTVDLLASAFLAAVTQ